LKEIQSNLLLKAKTFREQNTKTIDSYDEFKKEIEKGGFFLAHWDGTSETEEKIKEETKATIRCIPFNVSTDEGFCMVTGKPSKGRVVFAKAY
jgi:prolyl-tRNA synthetase